MGPEYVSTTKTAPNYFMTNNTDLLVIAIAKFKKHIITHKVIAFIMLLITATGFSVLIFASSTLTGLINVANVLSTNRSVMVRLTKSNEPYSNNTAKIDAKQVEKMARGYHPQNIYQAKNYMLSSAQGVFNIVKGGKEADSLAEMQKTNDPDKLDKFESIANFVTIYPDDLVKQYKFADSAWNPASNRIPIILSSEQAAGLLNTQKPADMRTAQQKVNQLAKIYHDIKDKTFDMCYRPKPADVSPCQKITFQVVGLSPSNYYSYLYNNEPGETENYNSKGKYSLAKMIFSPGGVQGAIPESMYKSLPNYQQLDSIMGKIYNQAKALSTTFYVKFANTNDANQFMTEQTCHYRLDISTNGLNHLCKPESRQYTGEIVFSNISTVQEFQRKLARFAPFVVSIIIAPTFLVTLFIVGRTIRNDSHDNAILRAIGFRRADTIRIYMLYGIILSIITALTSLVLGLIASVIANIIVSADISAQITLNYGLNTNIRNVSIVDFDFSQLSIILLATFLSTFVATLIPVIKNNHLNIVNELRSK